MRTKISIILNSIIFVSIAVTASIGIIFGAGDGQKGDAVIGLGYFKPFTMDSNILAAISALMVIIFTVKAVKSGAGALPKWVMNLHLMATASLCLTFLIAALFLAPMNAMSGEGFFSMFSNDMFFFHLVNPVLSFVSFTLIQKSVVYKRRACIIGAVPTIVYSFVYLFMVAIIKKWDDFYNFTLGGNYGLIPLVFVVIYGAVLAMSLILIFLHNKNVTGRK